MSVGRFVWLVAMGMLWMTGCVLETDASPVSISGQTEIASPARPGLRCPLPEEPYGVEVGSRMAPFTLTACDGSDYELYGADRCDFRFTVVVIVAGWCRPAITMSSALEAEVIEPYAPEGVRVLTIITQTEEYAAPDEAYCSAFEAAFGLTEPVLIDPTQTTGVYNPGSVLPATLVIDETGTIRHRGYGYSPGDLPLVLDALLGGEEPREAEVTL